MKTVLLLALVLLFVSCSHSKHKEVKAQVEQSQVKDPAALTVTIDEAIESSPNLTKEQKEELHKIIAANKSTAVALNEESFKLRGVMIKELLSGNMDPKKIKILKKDIRKVENDKLKNTFATVEKISALVGKNKDRMDFSLPLMNMDVPMSR